MVSRRGRNTSLDSGGCVVIVASYGEGAGTPSAIGQASTIYGVTCPRLVDLGSGPRGRHLAHRGQQLGPRPQDLPRRCSRRLRRTAGPVVGPPDQRTALVAGRAGRDRRPSPVRTRCAGHCSWIRPSAVHESRELRRNSELRRQYRPLNAHCRACTRR